MSHSFAKLTDDYIDYIYAINWQLQKNQKPEDAMKEMQRLTDVYMQRLSGRLNREKEVQE